MLILIFYKKNKEFVVLFFLAGCYFDANDQNSSNPRVAMAGLTFWLPERKKNFLAVDESTLGGTEVASAAGEPVLVSGVCTPQICEIMTPK